MKPLQVCEGDLFYRNLFYFFLALSSRVVLSSQLALDAESEHMVQEAIDHMLAEGRGKDGNPGEST